MRTSAGILLYRRAPRTEVLLVHPGGPFWARRDEGAWSIPKGEHEAADDPLECALREFEEETGTRLEPATRPLPLGAVKLKSGKRVAAWAVEGDLDADAIRSNTFDMEWPPRSGATRSFPEVDRAGWFAPDEARRKLNPAQVDLLERLLVALGEGT